MSAPANATGVPPHQRVALALLRARAPHEHAPTGYNDARGRLWVRMLAHRTLPTADEFETEWRKLHAALVGAGADAAPSPLNAALTGLNEAWGAAIQSGLLDAWERS
jgi:hypothetical protein